MLHYSSNRDSAVICIFLLRSAVEQAKMKFNVLPRSFKREPPPPPPPPTEAEEEVEFASDSVSQSLRQMSRELLSEGNDADDEGPTLKEGGGAIPPSATTTTRVGPRFYGLQPKFVRMRELHLFLFYLTRGYEGVGTAAESEDQRLAAAKDVARHCGSDVDEQLENELTAMDIYRPEELDWRTFIPPLPEHQVRKSSFLNQRIQFFAPKSLKK